MYIKQLTLSIMFALSCALTSMAQEPSHVDRKYDRFKDKTSLVLDYMLVANGTFEQIYKGQPMIQLSAVYQCPGDVQTCKPEQVYLTMLVTTNEHEYKLPGRLIILADGKRYPLGIMQNLGKAGEAPTFALFSIVLMVEVPYQTFVDVVTSKKVEMQLDDTEFELSKEHTSALLDFFASMHSKK